MDRFKYIPRFTSIIVKYLHLRIAILLGIYVTEAANQQHSPAKPPLPQRPTNEASA